MPASLTVVILTLNEADRIARCLRSVPPLARVVIIDSHSTDGTAAAAHAAWSAAGRAAGDLAFVRRDWPGFTRARNESLRWVRTPWVLWLDADEWITPELAADLARVTDPAATSTYYIYQIPRLTWFLGREIRHGGWYPDAKRRLALSRACEWRRGRHDTDVHEDLHPREAAPVGQLRGHLGHETFRDERDQRETNERYSTLLAEGLARRLQNEGKRAPSGIYIQLKVFVKFIENYFWKRGFLDGRPGYVIARGSAHSLRLRLQKTRQRMLAESHPPDKLKPLT